MRQTHIFDILRLSLLLFTLVLSVWGCAPKQAPMTNVDMLATPNLLLEANAAWDAKRYEVAELYYTKLLEREDLTRENKLAVYPRLADAAYRNEHFHQARIALEDWANLQTDALSEWTWERLYLDTMAQLGKTERLRNHQAWVLRNDRIPWPTREAVALWYSQYYQTRGYAERGLDVLADFYYAAPDAAAQAGLERKYLQRLQDMTAMQMDELSGAVTTENLWRFPYSLVGFEFDVRKASDKKAWSAVWRNLGNIVQKAELVDPSPLKEKLAELESQYGVPRIGIALALPLTGPYGKVGVKILRGAGLAQWRLAQQGIDIDMRVINTESTGWSDRLAGLPSHYTVVGGPLRVSAFKELTPADTSNDIFEERAFFTFMSSLGDRQEGQDAWRFFTSRNDEVRSLVRMVVEELGIKDLAIFYPEEKFGRAMAEAFYSESYPLGGRIKGMQSYPPRNLKQWGVRIGKLLNVPDDFSENKDAPLEQPDFGAVFIPDGWGQAQTLLPNFFFYEGDQLVFLGPGLWSRALDNAKDIDEHYYRLAVCPGAWLEDSDGGRNLQNALTEEGLGEADFWVALGYDFLRFAGKIGAVSPGWDADDINTRILEAQNIAFSMAPISWDEDGLARQDLFLFSPVRNGKQLVDADKMKVRIEKAKARRVKRVEAYEKRMENEAQQEMRETAPAE